MEAILTKYRPATFDDVLGQEAQVAALRGGLSRHKVFLFSGPSGVGKTTLARIVATEVGAGIDRTIEIDAPSAAGVENARALFQLVTQPQLIPRPLCLIVDECHVLSRPAFQVLLKPGEDPPEHLYICLCTTEVGKVPDTVKSRCLHIPLKPISPDILSGYLQIVADNEGWQVTQDTINAIIQSSNGSLRQALSYLSAVSASHAITGNGTGTELVPGASRGDLVKMLAKSLGSGGKKDWSDFAKLLKESIETDDVSDLAIAVARYLTAEMLSTKQSQRAGTLANLISGLAQASGDRQGQTIAMLALAYLDS